MKIKDIHGATNNYARGQLAQAASTLLAMSNNLRDFHERCGSSQTDSEYFVDMAYQIASAEFTRLVGNLTHQYLSPERANIELAAQLVLISAEGYSYE